MAEKDPKVISKSVQRRKAIQQIRDADPSILQQPGSDPNAPRSGAVIDLNDPKQTGGRTHWLTQNRKPHPKDRAPGT